MRKNKYSTKQPKIPIGDGGCKPEHPHISFLYENQREIPAGRRRFMKVRKRLFKKTITPVHRGMVDDWLNTFKVGDEVELVDCIYPAPPYGRITITKITRKVVYNINKPGYIVSGVYVYDEYGCRWGAECLETNLTPIPQLLEYWQSYVASIDSMDEETRVEYDGYCTLVDSDRHDFIFNAVKQGKCPFDEKGHLVDWTEHIRQKR